MGAIKNLSKRYQRYKTVKFNQKLNLHEVKPSFLPASLYFKHPKHAQMEKDLWWLTKELYFHHYCPSGEDTIVDLGAGYGEEILYWLKWRCELDGKPLASGQWPGERGRYFAVEIQPSVYECLCLNVFPWAKHVKAWPLALGESQEVLLPVGASYFSLGQDAAGVVPVPGQSWAAFCERHQIERVQLLKMNIEGGEFPFLNSLTQKDWQGIERLIISCHDFRANNNEGEHFRTKAKVLSLLEKQGYQIKSFHHGINWADDWIFAARL